MSKGRFPLSRDSGNQASKDSCQSSATDNLLLNGVKIVAPDDESLNGNEAEMLKNNFLHHAYQVSSLFFFRALDNKRFARARFARLCVMSCYGLFDSWYKLDVMAGTQRSSI